MPMHITDFKLTLNKTLLVLALLLNNCTGDNFFWNFDDISKKPLTAGKDILILKGNVSVKTETLQNVQDVIQVITYMGGYICTSDIDITKCKHSTYATPESPTSVCYCFNKHDQNNDTVISFFIRRIAEQRKSQAKIKAKWNPSSLGLPIVEFDIGQLPEIRVDPCITYNCSLDRKCVQYFDEGKGKLCDCEKESVGGACTQVKSCNFNNCSTNGTCLVDYGEEERGYTCKCDPGYKGDDCDQIVPCMFNRLPFSNCSKDGKCVVDEEEAHGYRCDCNSGYMGSFCEKKNDDNAGITASVTSLVWTTTFCLMASYFLR